MALWLRLMLTATSDAFGSLLDEWLRLPEQTMDPSYGSGKSAAEAQFLATCGEGKAAASEAKHPDLAKLRAMLENFEPVYLEPGQRVSNRDVTKVLEVRPVATLTRLC